MVPRVIMVYGLWLWLKTASWFTTKIHSQSILSYERNSRRSVIDVAQLHVRTISFTFHVSQFGILRFWKRILPESRMIFWIHFCAAFCLSPKIRVPEHLLIWITLVQGEDCECYFFFCLASCTKKNFTRFFWLWSSLPTGLIENNFRNSHLSELHFTILTHNYLLVSRSSSRKKATDE